MMAFRTGLTAALLKNFVRCIRQEWSTTPCFPEDGLQIHAWASMMLRVRTLNRNIELRTWRKVQIVNLFDLFHPWISLSWGRRGTDEQAMVCSIGKSRTPEFIRWRSWENWLFLPALVPRCFLLRQLWLLGWKSPKQGPIRKQNTTATAGLSIRVLSPCRTSLINIWRVIWSRSIRAQPITFLQHSVITILIAEHFLDTDTAQIIHPQTGQKKWLIPTCRHGSWKSVLNLEIFRLYFSHYADKFRKN